MKWLKYLSSKLPKSEKYYTKSCLHWLVQFTFIATKPPNGFKTFKQFFLLPQKLRLKSTEKKNINWPQTPSILYGRDYLEGQTDSSYWQSTEVSEALTVQSVSTNTMAAKGSAAEKKKQKVEDREEVRERVCGKKLCGTDFEPTDWKFVITEKKRVLINGVYEHAWACVPVWKLKEGLDANSATLPHAWLPRQARRNLFNVQHLFTAHTLLHYRFLCRMRHSLNTASRH